MLAKNVVCIVADRLHTGMLGAYGNRWIRTPHFDTLACQSFLFDQAFVHSPQLEDLYRALWFSDPHPSPADLSKRSSLAQRLQAESMHTMLVTDDSSVMDFAGAGDFTERLLVDCPIEPQTARDLDDTQLTRLFGTATESILAARQPFFAWIHTRAMAHGWDAPYALREQYADVEDPRLTDLVQVPDFRLSDDYDPDHLLGITHAYAGQVSALDHSLGRFVEELTRSGLSSCTQLTFLSARGYPLGEHQRVGPCDDALFNEMTSLAWLMRFPDQTGQLARSGALVQPGDLPRTWLDWLGLDDPWPEKTAAGSLMPIIRDEIDALHQAVYLKSRHDRALRTPAWLLRQTTDGATELYAKPSDRWEVNEVASLCPEIVSLMQAVLARFELDGHWHPPAPLSDELISEVD